MLLPLAGAAIISALPKNNEKAAKQAALGTTLVVMAVTIAMAVGFQRANQQHAKSYLFQIDRYYRIQHFAGHISNQAYQR